jgi:putative phage-type endonuclease
MIGIVWGTISLLLKQMDQSTQTGDSIYDTSDDGAEDNDDVYDDANDDDIDDIDTDDDDSSTFGDDFDDEDWDEFFENAFAHVIAFFDNDANVLKMASASSPIEDEIAAEISDWMMGDFRMMEFVREHIVLFALEEAACRDIPCRQIAHYGLPSWKSVMDRKRIDHKLAILDRLPFPDQRTPQWYETRYNIISATAASKVLASEAQRNSVIYEKIKPYEEYMAECNGRTNYRGTMTPMEWGVKYEPVSVLLYEKRNRTKLAFYGCVVHAEYPFIGASPDGINHLPSSPLYGRMVEIKNIVNREITGVPSDAYWIQMQMQMEVCDLEECDFLETRIREFDGGYDEYLAYMEENKDIVVYEEEDDRECDKSECDKSECGQVVRVAQKSRVEFDEATGTIRYLPSMAPYYVYSEIGERREWTQWMKQEIQEEEYTYTVSYWYVDEYSCVFVPRNRTWFMAALPHLRECWNTIVEERIGGSVEHRAPKRRKGMPETSAIIVVNKLQE